MLELNTKDFDEELDSLGVIKNLYRKYINSHRELTTSKKRHFGAFLSQLWLVYC